MGVTKEAETGTRKTRNISNNEKCLFLADWQLRDTLVSSSGYFVHLPDKTLSMQDSVETRTHMTARAKFPRRSEAGFPQAQRERGYNATSRKCFE